MYNKKKGSFRKDQCLHIKGRTGEFLFHFFFVGQMYVIKAVFCTDAKYIYSRLFLFIFYIRGSRLDFRVFYGREFVTLVFSLHVSMSDFYSVINELFH